MGWTTEKLKQLHTSVPANPLLAEPLYLAGYIERLGTGTTDIVDKCLTAGLPEPRFIQAEDFKTILYRSGTDQVKALIRLMENEHSRNDLMQLLDLKHGQTFRDNYLNPALIEMLIEMTQPESPNSPTQKYRLTAKGKALKEILKKKK